MAQHCKTLIGAGVAFAAWCGLAPSEAHPLGQYVYRNSADRLVMVFPYQNYWPIRYRVPPYAGYLDGDYPFEEARGDRPTSDLFRTHFGSKLEIVIVGFDPGFYVRDPFDITIAYRNPAERMAIGTTGTDFLTFPWWHLDTSDPNYIPGQESYAASYYLHDIDGRHSDSEIYTFRVYPNEGFCPADLTTTAVPSLPGYGIPNQILSTDDFFYYLTEFVAGNMWVADLTSTALPGTPGYGVPDGFVNNDDFFYYVALYALGC